MASTNIAEVLGSGARVVALLCLVLTVVVVFAIAASQPNYSGAQTSSRSTARQSALRGFESDHHSESRQERIPAVNVASSLLAEKTSIAAASAEKMQRGNSLIKRLSARNAESDVLSARMAQHAHDHAHNALSREGSVKAVSVCVKDVECSFGRSRAKTRESTARVSVPIGTSMSGIDNRCTTAETLCQMEWCNGSLDGQCVVSAERSFIPQSTRRNAALSGAAKHLLRREGERRRLSLVLIGRGHANTAESRYVDHMETAGNCVTNASQSGFANSEEHARRCVEQERRPMVRMKKSGQQKYSKEMRGYAICAGAQRNIGENRHTQDTQHSTTSSRFPREERTRWLT